MNFSMSYRNKADNELTVYAWSKTSEFFALLLKKNNKLSSTGTVSQTFSIQGSHMKFKELR